MVSNCPRVENIEFLKSSVNHFIFNFEVYPLNILEDIQ